MKKKILALVLAVAMMLTLIPFSFANESDSEQPAVEEVQEEGKEESREEVEESEEEEKKDTEDLISGVFTTLLGAMEAESNVAVITFQNAKALYEGLTACKSSKAVTNYINNLNERQNRAMSKYVLYLDDKYPEIGDEEDLGAVGGKASTDSNLVTMMPMMPTMPTEMEETDPEAAEEITEETTEPETGEVTEETTEPETEEVTEETTEPETEEVTEESTEPETEEVTEETTEPETEEVTEEATEPETEEVTEETTEPEAEEVTEETTEPETEEVTEEATEPEMEEITEETAEPDALDVNGMSNITRLGSSDQEYKLIRSPLDILSLCAASIPATARILASTDNTSATSKTTKTLEPEWVKEGLYVGKVANKTGEKTEDKDIYRITMGAYVTGKMSETLVTKPTDIVLVLDRSTSMGYKDYPDGNYTQSSLTTNSALCNSSDFLYLDTGTTNTEYHRLTVKKVTTSVTISGSSGGSPGSPPGSSSVDVSTYGYYYLNDNYELVLQETVTVYQTDDSLPSGIREKVYSCGKTSRNDALCVAVSEFIEAVQNNNDPSNSHRIAVVGFANPQNNGTDSLNNTGLLSGTEIYNYGDVINLSTNKLGNLSEYRCDGEVKDSQKLKDSLRNVDEDGLSDRIKGNLGTVNGGTWVDYGLRLAQEVFNSTKVNGAYPSDRNRMVVVMTDGEPGGYGWTGNDTVPCANSAVTLANALKDEDSTNAEIYSIGIFDGANPYEGGDYTDTSKEDTTRTNSFMQTISSNNGTAPAYGSEDNYYLVAENAASLADRFETISRYVKKPDSKLSVEAIMNDMLSTYFVFPNYAQAELTAEDLGLTFYKVPATGYTPESESEKEYYTFPTTYTEEMELSATQIEDIATESYKNGLVYQIHKAEAGEKTETDPIYKDKDAILISGFDFSSNENCCAHYDTTVQGYMLVVEFNVVMKDGFWGGNEVPTNDAKSGIYGRNPDGSIGEEEGKLPDPFVDVVVTDPKIKTAEAYVYYGKETKEGDEVIVKPEYDWQDDYATFKVLENSAQRINEEIKKSPESRVIVADLSLQIVPRIEGSVTEQTVSGVSLTVYILKPEFSVTGVDKDSANMGESVNLHTECTSSEEVKWKYDGKEDTEYTMSTKEKPSISGQTYTFYFADKTSESVGNLAGENFVPTVDNTSANFKIDSISCTLGTGTYAKSWTATVTKTVCSGQEGPLTVTPDPDTGEDHDFTVTVKCVPAMTITKTGMAEGETAIFKITWTEDKEPKEMYVDITGSTSSSVSRTIVGVEIGTEYTVEEITSWSWKYDGGTPSVSRTIDASRENNIFSFTNTPKTGITALNDEDHCENVFGILPKTSN